MKLSTSWSAQIMFIHFKNRLDRFWANQKLIFEYKSMLAQTGNATGFCWQFRYHHVLVSLFHYYIFIWWVSRPRPSSVFTALFCFAMSWHYLTKWPSISLHDHTHWLTGTFGTLAILELTQINSVVKSKWGSAFNSRICHFTNTHFYCNSPTIILQKRRIQATATRQHTSQHVTTKNTNFTLFLKVCLKLESSHSIVQGASKKYTPMIWCFAVFSAIAWNFKANFWKKYLINLCAPNCIINIQLANFITQSSALQWLWPTDSAQKLTHKLPYLRIAHRTGCETTVLISLPKQMWLLDSPKSNLLECNDVSMRNVKAVSFGPDFRIGL